MGDLEKEMGKERAAAVATTVMAFEVFGGREREREGEKWEILVREIWFRGFLAIRGGCIPRSQLAFHALPRGNNVITRGMLNFHMLLFCESEYLPWVGPRHPATSDCEDISFIFLLYSFKSFSYCFSLRFVLSLPLVHPSST